MKHLCCDKIVILLLVFFSSLYGAINDKSALVYYGKDISYPLAGLHNYIIVQPDISTYSHGFSVYKNKIYAYVSIGEVDTNSTEYKNIDKKWILGDNKAWHSKVLDITNKAYQQFLFSKVIEPLHKKGFKNFFFDTLDSYMLVDKTPQARKKSQDALANFINEFHQKYPHAKLIINRGFHIIDKVHSAITAVLFESYYQGFNGKNYTKFSDKDRAWLAPYLQKIKSYGLDIIDVEYLPHDSSALAKTIVKKVEEEGMIPYIANKRLDNYGLSSVNPIKREILFLVDANMQERYNSAAHLDGATPLEYLGYIQKLYDINKGLPKISSVEQYGGVVVWLKKNYKDPQALVDWLQKVKERHIKIIFASSFGFTPTNSLLKPFGIHVINATEDFANKKKIIQKSSMMGFEMPPSANTSNTYLQPKDAKAQLTYEDSHGVTSTPVAITPWGGYAIGDGFTTSFDNYDIWVTNPFLFYAKALRLQPLIVPDTTTENGLRLMFAHEDGDGSMNRVEWNPKLFSIYSIYEYILKKFSIPFSISVVGAEIDKNGLYPKDSKELRDIAKKIYALPNVEAATHTFTHPFAWEEIDANGNLAPQYRLDPKGYKFNIDYEILGQLKDINEHLLPKGKSANMIFWSGDCRPSYKVLKLIYRHGILNMNGGDTTITNLHPWLSAVAPLGLGKGQYYQIYTGAQNEDIYTNLWQGPFWGYKKVIQTFKLTGSPRRLKPIDIYFHFYTGSKRASLNALEYVIKWAMKQPFMPIYTSAYIPKAMDFYTVSMANEGNQWLFSGMQSLHTLRIEEPDAFINFDDSKGVVGVTHFQNHTYLSLDNNQTQLITVDNRANRTNHAYLISANGKLSSYKATHHKRSQILTFEGEVPLKIAFYLPKSCSLQALPKADKRVYAKQHKLTLSYEKTKKATLNVFCKN